VIPGIFEGINATVFAYGATGSGKTYTMQVTVILLTETCSMKCHCWQKPVTETWLIGYHTGHRGFSGAHPFGSFDRPGALHWDMVLRGDFVL
jgi:hypothetical protein